MRGRGGGPQSSCECLYAHYAYSTAAKGKKANPKHLTHLIDQSELGLTCLLQTIDRPLSPPITNTQPNPSSGPSIPAIAISSLLTFTYIMHIEVLGRLSVPQCSFQNFSSRLVFHFPLPETPPPPLSSRT